MVSEVDTIFGYIDANKRTIKLLSIYEARDEPNEEKQLHKIDLTFALQCSCDQFLVQTDIYGTLMVSACTLRCRVRERKP